MGKKIREYTVLLVYMHSGDSGTYMTSVMAHSAVSAEKKARAEMDGGRYANCVMVILGKHNDIRGREDI